MPGGGERPRAALPHLPGCPQVVLEPSATQLKSCPSEPQCPVDRGSVGQPGELLTLGGRVHRPGCPVGEVGCDGPGPGARRYSGHWVRQAAARVAVCCCHAASDGLGVCWVESGL